MKVDIDLKKHKEEIFDWIRAKFGPGDIFSDATLERWADFHGWTKTEEVSDALPFGMVPEGRYIINTLVMSNNRIFLGVHPRKHGSNCIIFDELILFHCSYSPEAVGKRWIGEAGALLIEKIKSVRPVN